MWNMGTFNDPCSKPQKLQYSDEEHLMAREFLVVSSLVGLATRQMASASKISSQTQKCKAASGNLFFLLHNIYNSTHLQIWSDFFQWWGCILAAAAGIRRHEMMELGYWASASSMPITLTCLRFLPYAGPLLLVLISRFLTLSAMALYAASLGTTALAAYQVRIFVDFVVSKLPNGVEGLTEQRLFWIEDIRAHSPLGDCSLSHGAFMSYPILSDSYIYIYSFCLIEMRSLSTLSRRCLSTSTPFLACLVSLWAKQPKLCFPLCWSGRLGKPLCKALRVSTNNHKQSNFIIFSSIQVWKHITHWNDLKRRIAAGWGVQCGRFAADRARGQHGSTQQVSPAMRRCVVWNENDRDGLC